MIYIEMADGSMYPWEDSVSELLEKIYELKSRGYTVKVRVL